MGWSKFGIDHVVHVVKDLDAAGAFFEALGFEVGGRNVHPFGTQNRLVIFKNTYIELISVVEPDKVPASTEEAFSFAGAVKTAWELFGEGLHHLALRGHHLENDAAQLAEAQLAIYPPVRFARSRPDGGEARFGLIFPKNETSDSVVFHCIHETPEAVYGLVGKHSNGAEAVSSVIFASESPADHHEFLTKITGEHDMHATSSGVFFAIPDGRLEVYSPEAMQSMIGMKPVVRDTRLKAQGYEIRLESLDGIKSALEKNLVPFAVQKNRVIVPAEHGFGACLIFSTQTTD